MGDTPKNTEGVKGPASLFEQAQEMVDDLTKNLKDAQFQKVLAAHQEEFMAAEPADSDGELTQEDMEATEQLKAQIRLQEQCNYVRGLCRKIIAVKRGDSNSTAYREADHCLTLVQKIEAGDNGTAGQELNDAFHILLQALRAEDETLSGQASSQEAASSPGSSQPKDTPNPPPTKEAPALQKPDPEPNGQRQTSASAGAHMNVTIQNSNNVTIGNIPQTQKLATGNRSSIGKEPIATVVASWLWRHIKALFHRLWKSG
jgi:hypothetical protein